MFNWLKRLLGYKTGSVRPTTGLTLAGYKPDPKSVAKAKLQEVKRKTQRPTNTIRRVSDDGVPRQTVTGDSYIPVYPAHHDPGPSCSSSGYGSYDVGSSDSGGSCGGGGSD